MEKEKITITVSGCPSDMQGWFAEKSGRVLEELAFLADVLRRPGDEPAGGWPTKQEEIDFHLTQAVKNALKIAALSNGRKDGGGREDIDRIIGEGHRGYLQYRGESQP